MAKRIGPSLETPFKTIMQTLEHERDLNPPEIRCRTRSGRQTESVPDSPVTKLIKGHIIFKIMELQTKEVPKLPRTDLQKAAQYADKARKIAQRHITERARNAPSKPQDPTAGSSGQADPQHNMGKFYI